MNALAVNALAVTKHVMTVLGLLSDWGGIFITCVTCGGIFFPCVTWGGTSFSCVTWGGIFFPLCHLD